MIKNIFLVGMLITTSTCLSSGPAKPGPEPVQDFDLSKYLGTWYEIGSIPQIFQKGCECTRATYVKRSDSKIDVLNQCRKKGVTGPVSEAKGVARFKGQPNIGDLELSFFLWFYGSYRIIALDKAQYQWALVSNDKASTLWILARSPVMPQQEIEKLLIMAKQQGVDTSLFQLQKQDSCWN